MTAAREWKRLYTSCTSGPAGGVFTGFNANADRIIRVDRGRLESDHRFRRPGMEEVTARLRRSMDRHEADEWFIDDAGLYEAIARAFSDGGELRLGGQAGIAATHLASRLGCRVAYYVPTAPAACRRAIEKSGARPLLPHPPAPPLTTNCHLVFEYPGLEGRRANRFIVSPRERWDAPVLPQEFHDDPAAHLRGIRRAFLSGYHYLKDGGAAMRATRELSAIGRLVRTHVECVAPGGQDLIRNFIDRLLPAAHSAGANEMELRLLLEGMGEEAAAERTAERPDGLLEGGLVLHRRIRGRLHLHTHGYYLLITDGDLEDPARSRDALMRAAIDVAERAGGGKVRGEITARGLAAVGCVEERADRVVAPGVCIFDDRWVIAVPTLVVEPAVRTVGLGDVLSSTAFVCDPMV